MNHLDRFWFPRKSQASTRKLDLTDSLPVSTLFSLPRRRMTERPGGSDVSMTETTAERIFPLKDGEKPTGGDTVSWSFEVEASSESLF